MSNALNGVFWDREALQLNIPFQKTVDEALRVFDKNLPLIACHTISTLEHIPLTFAQSVTISHGYSVSDLSIRDLNRVDNYFSGMRALTEMIRVGQFGLNKYTACVLHGLTGKGEAKNYGQFRNGSVGLYKVMYSPPEALHLPEIAQRGFAYLSNEIADPKERAIGVFLFMARNQFFFDVNRRTASLMMNGVLLSHGYAHLSFLANSSENFDKVLTDFYESGDANPMMRYLENQISQLFEEPKTSLPESKKLEL